MDGDDRLFKRLKWIWIMSLSCVLAGCGFFANSLFCAKSVRPADSKKSICATVKEKKAYSVQPAACAQKRKVAYLTFDDGPSALTPELLDELNQNHVKATFFVVGLNAEKYPDTLKQMTRDGDVIGVHSWTHNYAYIYKNTENFFTDFNQLKVYINQLTGICPSICRFPGGTNNTICRRYNRKHIMRRIVRQVHGMGFQYYDWNVSSGEASAVPPSESAIVTNVTTQCQDKNTAVILFHDTDNKNYVKAVPQIIVKLRSEGFLFETLSPHSPSGKAQKAMQFTPT